MRAKILFSFWFVFFFGLILRVAVDAQPLPNPADIHNALLYPPIVELRHGISRERMYSPNLIDELEGPQQATLYLTSVRYLNGSRQEQAKVHYDEKTAAVLTQRDAMGDLYFQILSREHIPYIQASGENPISLPSMATQVVEYVAYVLRFSKPDDRWGMAEQRHVLFVFPSSTLDITPGLRDKPALDYSPIVPLIEVTLDSELDRYEKIENPAVEIHFLNANFGKLASYSQPHTRQRKEGHLKTILRTIFRDKAECEFILASKRLPEHINFF